MIDPDNMNDNRCSSRKEDWKRFLGSFIGKRFGHRKRHDNPIISYFLVIGHTAKNVVVEERRRWTGECP